MATGADRHSGLPGVTAHGGGVDALPVLEAGEQWDEARVGERCAAPTLPQVIEVSDKDYRSFCFPCHALEEAGDCNDAV